MKSSIPLYHAVVHDLQSSRFAINSIEKIARNPVLLSEFVEFCGSLSLGNMASFLDNTVRFRHLPPSSAEQFNLGSDIYYDFLVPTGSKRFEYPPAIGANLKTSMSDALSRKLIPVNIFDDLLIFVKLELKQKALPAFQKNSSGSDSKSCRLCLTPFGFLKRKHACPTCSQCFCKECLSRSFGDMQICSFCFFSNSKEPFHQVFALAFSDRQTPIILSAESLEMKNKWMDVLENSLDPETRASIGRDSYFSESYGSSTELKHSPSKEEKQPSDKEDSYHRESLKLHSTLHADRLPRDHFEDWLEVEDAVSGTWTRNFFIVHQKKIWIHDMSLKV